MTCAPTSWSTWATQLGCWWWTKPGSSRRKPPRWGCRASRQRAGRPPPRWFLDAAAPQHKGPYRGSALAHLAGDQLQRLALPPPCPELVLLCW
jgi:hypothetical protein